MTCGSETSLSYREDFTLFPVLIRWFCNVLPTQCLPHWSLWCPRSVNCLRLLCSPGVYEAEIKYCQQCLSRINLMQNIDGWIANGSLLEEKKILGILSNVSLFLKRHLAFLQLCVWLNGYCFQSAVIFYSARFCVQIVVSFVIEGKMSPSTKTLLT